MRSRDVVGRKIVAIDKAFVKTRVDGRRQMLVDGIVLDNGVVLRFITVETDFDFYGHQIVVTKPRRKS